MEVKFKALCASFEMPKQETAGAAGFDLRYYGDSSVCFSNLGEKHVLDLGFAMEIPEGYEAQMRPRSGLASKYGLTLLNSPGTIDCDYRGPVKAIMVKNAYAPEFTINPGDRVCQMVLQKIPEVRLLLVDDLSDTVRGAGGFGSTGVK